MAKIKSSNYSSITDVLDTNLMVSKSFDLIKRELEIGGKKACIYFIDGFAKDEILEKLMNFFMGLKKEDVECTVEQFQTRLLPYGEVDLKDDLSEVEVLILSGVPCLVIEGFQKLLLIDCRTYPQRGVEEPEKDKVMRGSRDGFVETLVFNTALIRRRIRDPHLVMQMLAVGKSSHTDIVVCYLENRVNKELLNKVVQKIQNIKIDALTLNQESLAECMYKGCWLNPFPKFRYTERPDAAAASVLEGKIIVVVDNSPSVMILPTSLFGLTEEADDYYFPPVTGTYLRLSRIFINFIALLLTPVFLLLIQHPEWIPEGLSFIKIKDTINIPVVVQFLILEFSIDGLRIASMNTPNMLSTPFSVLAALILGDFTVSSGWFNSEVMLYMAFVAIANYSQVSFELGYALKFMRIITLILTGLFSLYGFIAGILITLFAVIFNKTISGHNYLYPLIPFNARLLVRHLFRISLPASEKVEKQ